MTISALQWSEAQAVEAVWWRATPARMAEVAAGHAWIREALDLDAAALDGVSVTDLGGGPVPIVGHADLPLATRIVVDPLTVGGWPCPVPVTRIVAVAEDYQGPQTDEVWGYNVLQHARDPLAVLETAKAHAVHRVRWLEYVDTPLAVHHPHSTRADWLLGQFSGWDVWRQVQGAYEGVQFVALVADRIA